MTGTIALKIGRRGNGVLHAVLGNAVYCAPDQNITISRNARMQQLRTVAGVEFSNHADALAKLEASSDGCKRCMRDLRNAVAFLAASA